MNEILCSCDECGKEFLREEIVVTTTGRELCESCLEKSDEEEEEDE